MSTTAREPNSLESDIAAKAGETSMGIEAATKEDLDHLGKIVTTSYLDLSLACSIALVASLVLILAGLLPIPKYFKYPAMILAAGVQLYAALALWPARSAPHLPARWIDYSTWWKRT